MRAALINLLVELAVALVIVAAAVVFVAGTATVMLRMSAYVEEQKRPRWSPTRGCLLPASMPVPRDCRKL